MGKVTPLRSLCRALCGDSVNRLFPNQVVMYRLLIPFISDRLNFYSGTGRIVSVDDLIAEIRQYIDQMYSNPTDDESNEEFERLHRFVYNNIANYDSGRVMPSYSTDRDILSVNVIGDTAGVSDISKVINNSGRGLPKDCERLLRENEDDYTPILYRCFWMIQYYLVYYDRKICHITRLGNPSSYGSGRFVEFFQINEKMERSIYSSLQENCSEFTTLIDKRENGKVDILSLSRIIIDVLIEQINLRQKFPIHRIPDTSVYMNRDESNGIIEQEQFAFFRKCIDGYGDETYDRYNVLRKMAASNCYAADELGNIYYFGKVFQMGKNNHIYVDRDYEKAVKCYTMSINNSNPPLQSSCWSMAETLMKMHYDTENERQEAEKKAFDYIRLAGEYPAAYNALARRQFAQAERDYDAVHNDLSEDIILEFIAAISLADRAGADGYFYGNNQIAIFLNKYSEDKKLLDTLRKRMPDIHIPLDISSQLKPAVSLGNPWALKYYAFFLLNNGQKTEAKKYMERSAEANYSAAYYELARNFYKSGSKKWKEMMQMASDRAYPAATFELAENTGVRQKKMSLLRLCMEQIVAVSDSEKDIELYDRAEKCLNELL